ncbi:MAG: DNA cytosine methyltransferase [Acidobacteriota bacterium]
MKIRTFLLILVFLLALLFTALNWEQFAAPASLNILIGRVDAPLGLLLLGAMGILTLVYLLLLSKSEAAALIESRRTLKDLEKARKVAEQAEESRIRELRDQLDIELEQLHGKIDRLLGVKEEEPASPAEGEVVAPVEDEIGKEAD